MKVTITIPTFSPKNSALELKETVLSIVTRLSEKLQTLFSGFQTSSQSFATDRVNTFNSYKMKKFFKNSFFLPIAVVVIIVIVITALTVRNMNNSNSQVLGDDQRFELPKATASQTLNKVYNFPLRDASGKEVSKLRYEITGAETRNEIIVKGQRNRAVQGRTFMILNIKITNTFDKAVSINSRDYIRLTVNDNSEKLAPTIHNDPVEVDPISTKYTRLGFALNDNDKNLTLQVGEVKGSKETLKLNLK